MSNNILVICDRMGDYHRRRLDVLRLQSLKSNIYSADLFNYDSLYKWESTSHSNHFKLSHVGKGTSFNLGIVVRFIKIISTKKINKVVLSGYGNTSYVVLSIIAKILRIDCYIFAESWYKKGLIIDNVKGLFLKALYKGIFVSGSRAESHFIRNLKQNKKRLFCGYSVVDNQHFSNDNLKVASDSGSKILLCVARLSVEKNIDFLLRGFVLSKMFQDWEVHILGSGPLEEILREKWNQPNIKWKGWVTYEDLPDYIAKSTYCILPSIFEPWGLVVNEYLSAGKLTFVSSACGSAPDLIRNPNLIFDPFELESLIRTLNFGHGLNEDHARGLIDELSLNLQEYSLEKWSDTFMRMLGIE